MGPIAYAAAVVNGFAWANYFLRAAVDTLGWAHHHVQVWLPMGLLRPIIFLGTDADALGWAHHNI